MTDMTEFVAQNAKQRGRPKTLAPDQKPSEGNPLIQFRIPRREMEEISNFCSSAGISPNEWARDRVLESIPSMASFGILQGLSAADRLAVKDGLKVVIRFSKTVTTTTEGDFGTERTVYKQGTPYAVSLVELKKMKAEYVFRKWQEDFEVIVS